MNEKELARIKMENKTETYGDVLICPWCHEKNEDCWELDDDGEEVDCDSCGEKIVYSVHRSVSYTGHFPDVKLNRLLKKNEK